MPDLYRYAATSWPYHLSSIRSTSSSALDTLLNLFRGSQVLAWIQVLGMLRDIKVLIYASRHLISFLGKCKRLNSTMITPLHGPSDMNLVEGWATDLIRIAGKFRKHLLEEPRSIYRLIPAFCPSTSKIHQVGHAATEKVLVTGIRNTEG